MEACIIISGVLLSVGYGIAHSIVANIVGHGILAIADAPTYVPTLPSAVFAPLYGTSIVIVGLMLLWIEIFLPIPAGVIANVIGIQSVAAYTTKAQLLEAVDDLPGGDDSGNTVVETLELWYRDPVDCIRELMGNPVFRDVMRYAPERVFEDEDPKSEVINEMWTAAWWWKLQKLLPPGATIAPIILSSDKTKLSNFRGDQSAWPVYLTIGNISKEIRRQASSHTTILVGYLPVGKFSGFSDKARQAVKYRTFHHCMTIITRSLISAGNDGVNMTCSDGFKIAVQDARLNQKTGGCHRASPLRDQVETLRLLREHQSGFRNPSTAAKSKADYDELGLRPVYAPFWADLPHSDIFQAFTPDLLHQLHRVFSRITWENGA
ncbi:hypothetical protein MVEN_00129500 [Mycena venus]|uniref:Uncharacterized protein n=1 Tax=Mycena venus TaxID=2733690 RepID=A0A8H6Z4Y9_9AGAR|nr:hypothetical protein MVEN_00129500 [Mycena venus]